MNALQNAEMPSIEHEVCSPSSAKKRAAEHKAQQAAAAATGSTRGSAGSASGSSARAGGAPGPPAPRVESGEEADAEVEASTGGAGVGSGKKSLEKFTVAPSEAPPSSAGPPARAVKSKSKVRRSKTTGMRGKMMDSDEVATTSGRKRSHSETSGASPAAAAPRDVRKKVKKATA